MEAPVAPVENHVTPSPSQLWTGQAARDGAWVLGAQLIGTAIALGVDALLFRTLSFAERGTLTAALAVQAVLLLFCDMGVALTTIRFGAEYHAKGMLAEANVVFRRALMTRMLLALGLTFIAFFLSPLLVRYPLNAGGRVQLIWGGAAALMALSTISWAADVAQARRRFGAYFAQQVIAAGLRGWVVLIAAKRMTLDFTENAKFSSEIILWSIAAAACIAALFCIISQRETLQKLPGLTVETVTRLEEQIASFARYAAATVLLSGLVSYIEIFMLQSLLQAQDTAIFDGARRLAMILPLLTVAITTVLLPRAAALETPQACLQYAKKALWVCVPLTLLLAGGLALAAEVVVPLLWGERYEASILPLRLLCIGFGFNILLNPLTLLFYPLRREGTIVLLLALSLLLSIIGGALLIPRFGALGAAGSIAAVKALVMIGSGVLVYLFLRERLRTN